MAGLSNQNLFNGINSFAEDDISYHCIVTDNPHMAEIGLSVFTTGQLYNWMSQRNSRGEFVNLKYITTNENAYKPLSRSETVSDRILKGKLGSTIFGTSSSPNCGSYTDWMSFAKWERKNRTGEYIRTQYFNWTYYNQYTFTDIGFYTFQDNDIILQKTAGPYDDNYNLAAVSNTHIDDLISIFITLNDQSRYLPILRDFYKNPSPLPKNVLAGHEFIMDIKTSQNRCLEWSNTINFVSYIGSKKCVYPECVNFKLYLYDFTNPNNPNRTVAFNGDNLYITLPRKDEFGRLSRNDGSGEFDLPDPDPEKIRQSKAAAQIALTVNPSDGKAYSGSPTILVRLDQDLPAGEGPDYETNVDIKQELDTTKCIAPGTGIAIPIKEQNGNPFQWISQYSEQKCKKSNGRYKITVLNFSKNIFPSGVLGYATKIMGQGGWSFIPAGDYDQAIDRTPKDWSFTYLMMNFDNFFTSRWTKSNAGTRAINPMGNFNTPQYEEAVRRFYYGEPMTINNFSYAQILDNFPPLQVTSWDFMGPNIGGLREKNALSNTIFGKTNKGEPWPDFENGFYSTPFFGCVFPDGYDTGGKNYFEPITSPVNVKKVTNISDNSGFIKPISAGTKIFDNSQNDASINRGEDFDDGIFIEGTLQQTLNHLPADIATNGSGNPLNNYYHIYEAFQTTDLYNDPVATKEKFQTNISKIIGSNYNNKQIWLYEGDDPSASIFNFKPLNSYKLQFRPLKHEIYDAFQAHDISINPIIPYLRGTFARKARTYQKDGAMPIAEEVMQRSKWFTKTNWPDGVLPGDIGLVGNGANEGMQIAKVGGVNGKSLRYNYGLIRTYDLRDFSNGAKFPWVWRTYNPNRWLAFPEKGSGAIGVIGTSFTVSFQRAITFNTNYLFGMRSSFGPSNTLGGLGNLLGVPGKPWYQSIGGYGDEYYSLQNTQLYARIFHHWPKKYTIYDPAKFAVFHFNTNSDSLNYIDYYLDKDKTTPISNLQRICLDAVQVGINFENIKLIPGINSTRKEKLLPHKYTMKHTIGIPIMDVYTVGGININPPTPRYYDMVIDNPGSGYSLGDTFKVNGGSGTSPILKVASLNNNNGIIRLVYAENAGYGYNYNQLDFLRVDDNFLNGGGLEVVAVSTKGQGFRARIVRGSAVVANLTDPKPKYVGSQFIQLTGSIPVRENPNATIMEPVTGARTQSIQVDSANKSLNGKYDVFLHFHNDTSHTLIEGGGAAGPALENYVELEILPD